MDPSDESGASEDSQPEISVKGVSKRFFGTQALDDVSMSLPVGKVHAVIGENGAGKSTLIKVLGGVHRPDSGSVVVDGSRRNFTSPREALAAGIVVIPQEMRVMPAQTVAENVMLGRLPTKRSMGLVPGLDRRAMLDRAGEILRRLNLNVDLNARLETLSYAERQLVMIGRSLNHDARVLILDEPTASLEAREVERLFNVLGSLRDAGVAIVYVSHRLEEVERLADFCTVLRDGRSVRTARRGDLSRGDMAQLMTGRDLEQEMKRPHDLDKGEELMQTDSGGGVSIRTREVVGLAGLLGSGTTGLLRALFGASKIPISVNLRDRAARFSGPADAIRHGIGLVPGERSHGLIMGLTVRENIILPNLKKLNGFMGLDKAAVDALVADLMENVDIRPREPDRPARELSGGNQQKVIFARWLAGHADILLLDEPTHGIDVGAKAHVHRLMRQFVEDGGGILFASSEFTEVLSLSDGVAAMKDGEIVARLDRDGDYSERRLREALGS